LGNYAWFDGNSNKQTHFVGEKKANAWGLYDMHGNVLEWCSDRYGAVSDPTGSGLSFGSDRVSRGGWWLTEAAQCRSVARIRAYASRAFDNDIYGFRVALSSSGIPK